MNLLLKFAGAALAAVVGSKQRLGGGGGRDTAGVLADARLSYASQGRGGQVVFTNRTTRFELYYEFGGGNCLALIYVPTEKEWQRATGMPVAERQRVLTFIARQVIADQTSFGRSRYEISDDCITIYV